MKGWKSTTTFYEENFTEKEKHLRDFLEERKKEGAYKKGDTFVTYHPYRDKDYVKPYMRVVFERVEGIKFNSAEVCNLKTVKPFDAPDDITLDKLVELINTHEPNSKRLARRIAEVFKLRPELKEQLESYCKNTTLPE